MTTSRFEEEADTPTPETPPTRRVFRYETHSIPDPGMHLSVDEVRKALVLYFPDLVQATTTTRTEGDTLVITFTKQTTRKGAAGATPPSDLLLLTERLLALKPLPDRLSALALPEALTLADLAVRRDALHAALATCAADSHHCERIYRQCLTLPPIPCLTRLPPGF